jgi:hypothetical protein
MELIKAKWELSNWKIEVVKNIQTASQRDKYMENMKKDKGSTG